MTTDQEQIDALAEEMQEMVDDIHRVHKLRVFLSAAAIAYHVEAEHSGSWLVVPVGSRCSEGDCPEFIKMVENADSWLEGQRDMLDVPASERLWVSPWDDVEPILYGWVTGAQDA